MTVDELLKSKYAQNFDLKYGVAREGVLFINKPEFISIDLSGDHKIEEHKHFLFIITKSASLTLYRESVTTHTTIL